MQADTNLCACPSKSEGKFRNSSTTFLGAFRVAIISRFPFCMLDYFAAIIVCGTIATAVDTAGRDFYVSISLALVTLFNVLFNHEGRRSMVAASLILMGTALLSYSELYSGQVAHYYTGCLFLVVGVWAHGSLMFFVKFLKTVYKEKAGLRIHG